MSKKQHLEVILYCEKRADTNPMQPRTAESLESKHTLLTHICNPFKSSLGKNVFRLVCLLPALSFYMFKYLVVCICCMVVLRKCFFSTHGQSEAVELNGSECETWFLFSKVHFVLFISSQRE